MQIENQEFVEKLEKIFEEFKNSNHHAFLLETKNRDLVFNFFLEKLDRLDSFKENLFLNLKVFDIKKAREIIEYSKTNFSENHFILISFYSINREAQNALLKFLEEAETNLKIILIPHKGVNLLSTIISRLYRLEIINEKVEDESAEEEFLRNTAEKFLSTKRINRMNLKEIKDILSRKDEYALENEDKERSDREILERFLLNIHDILFLRYENWIQEDENIKEKHNENENEKDIEKKENEAIETINEKGDSYHSSNIFENEEKNKFNMFDYQNKEFISDIEIVVESIKYAKNNSSSGKTILEYLALKLPEISD